MEAASGLAYYHWIVMALSFVLLDLRKVGTISAPFAVAAGVQAIITYINPDMSWGWQVWGFVMLMALGAIFYLRRQPVKGGNQDSAATADESIVAAGLKGTKVYLQQPLFPGSSKLEVRGRYWKVSASRDFPAGVTVEVVGSRGNTLEIVSSEKPSYGDRDGHEIQALALDVYSRDRGIEAEYGVPNYPYWELFQQALADHRKLALVHAYHVLCGLKGMNVQQAKKRLNTYTLALYDTNKQGQFLHLQKDMYAQPRIYNFLYMNGKWTGTGAEKFEEEINDLIAALHSDWAVKFRGTIDAAMVLRAVMMIRKQQVQA